ncbi:MAG: hypothetical protein EXS16_19725 [Gemmataceae bacterium]|nr:hypothetical protein [Gemmataceae bacterium]
MVATVEQIVQAALALPVRDRERVIEELASSCATNEMEPLSAEWHAKIQRRSAEIDAGTVTCIPWAEVQAGLRKGE